MNESVELVINKLEELAGALRIGIEEIFPYFVLRVQIQAWTVLIIITLFTLATIYFAVQSVKKEWLEEVQIPLITTGTILLLVTIFVYVVFLPDLFVPQTQAITNIIRAMRGYR